MIIFAWILWGLYILGFTAVAAIGVASIAAINDGREVHLRLNLFSVLMNIAVFVFLNIYLFA